MQKLYIGIAAAVVGLILLIWAACNLVVINDASTIMVIQSPFTGKLSWYTDAGPKFACFGKVTRYNKRSTFWFSNKKDQGNTADESIAIRFNDGGHGHVSGSISWTMPVGDEALNKLHSTYGSWQAVEQQLVRTVVEKSVYTAGPLMSSTESYAERKNELLRDIEEQIDGGVYETETESQTVKDPLTGKDKSVNIVKIKMDNGGKPKHATDSPLTEFQVHTFNLSLNDIHYDDNVENQIKTQQEATVAVQTSIAHAKQAEQEAITVEQQGKAKAAGAKWDQEVLNAQSKAEAENKLAVAKLNVQTEDANKQAAILKGEGEAEARKLVMVADGALDKKLEAYKSVNKYYADAMAKYQGNWVPSVVMGSNGNTAAGSGAQQMIDMLSAKTARDLGLDLSMPKKTAPAPAPAETK